MDWPEAGPRILLGVDHPGSGTIIITHYTVVWVLNTRRGVQTTCAEGQPGSPVRTRRGGAIPPTSNSLGCVFGHRGIVAIRGL